MKCDGRTDFFARLLQDSIRYFHVESTETLFTHHRSCYPILTTSCFTECAFDFFSRVSAIKSSKTCFHENPMFSFCEGTRKSTTNICLQGSPRQNGTLVNQWEFQGNGHKIHHLLLVNLSRVSFTKLNYHWSTTDRCDFEHEWHWISDLQLDKPFFNSDLKISNRITHCLVNKILGPWALIFHHLRSENPLLLRYSWARCHSPAAN